MTLFRMKYGPHEADVCSGFVGQLFTTSSITVSKIKASVYIEAVTQPKRMGVINLSDVVSITPVVASFPTCDEHGKHCP